jgi:predicted nucleotidyltransferase
MLCGALGVAATEPHVAEISMNPEVEEYRRVLREAMPRLREEFGVDTLSLFGSRLRGDHRDDSDLDVLVTFWKTPGLFRYVELEFILSDLLGVKVDLVSKKSLKPRIGERILAEAQPV